MSEAYSFVQGTTPLLISIPHDGRKIPPAIFERMSASGRDIPDTDWHVEKLYDFAKGIGASVLVGRYSRYVVDLNRPASNESLYQGQVSTGLCPRQTFAGDDIYIEGADFDAAELSARVSEYWRPYHLRLQSALLELQQRFGYALLWDAHSIPSTVPRLFDGELPVLNIGTFDHRSCDPDLAAGVCEVAAASAYDWVFNGRFKGGYITRAYGKPDERIHAIQLEIAQRAYMNENTLKFDGDRADLLRQTLLAMLTTYLEAGTRGKE